MTTPQLLQLIEHIASLDAAEDVEMDVIKKRPVTLRERDLAHALAAIYMFTHAFTDCKHPDWQKEAEEAYKQLK